MNINIVDAFLQGDRPRVAEVLDDLLPVIARRYLFVGGISIRCNLLAATGQIVERHFNDLDLIADGPDSFTPELSKTFLIHHFHTQSDTTDFRFVLVHKATGTKVDVFHWKPSSPLVTKVNHSSRDHADCQIDIQAMPTQFAVTVFDLETMRQRGPVDPKQLHDAIAMEPYVHGPQATNSWQQLFDGQPACSLSNAYEAAKERVRTQPKAFYVDPWKSWDPHYKCAKCVDSAVWPIAPMKQIMGLLGYIEIDGENVL